MKHWTLISFTCILLLGCFSNDSKKYFDYDSIDYYFNDFDDYKIPELFDKQSDSELDSLKMVVILGRIPSDLNDITFIDKLETIGYAKKEIDKSKFKSIDEVFSEKPVDEMLATACIYVYRDILVFKKADHVVGIAKLCFDCMANEIAGTTLNTNNFGQNGDYERLFKIVRD